MEIYGSHPKLPNPSPAGLPRTRNSNGTLPTLDLGAKASPLIPFEVSEPEEPRIPPNGACIGSECPGRDFRVFGGLQQAKLGAIFIFLRKRVKINFIPNLARSETPKTRKSRPGCKGLQACQ